MKVTMAKEICLSCGKLFNGGKKAFFCSACRKKRLSESAKKRNLNKLGNAAYSKKARVEAKKDAIEAWNRRVENGRCNDKHSP